MTDSPEGQTQSYSQEEEIRATFKDWFRVFDSDYDRPPKRFETFNAGYQAALASQAEKIKGLEAAARFWQDKAGDMAEQVRKLEESVIVWNNEALRLAGLNAVNQRESREQLAKANEKIVMKFSEERVPEFSQGFKSHELLEPVTAEDCQHYVATIEQKNETIAALQARIEAADKQEPVGYVREYGVECLYGILVNQTTGRTPLPSSTKIDPYALCETDIPLFTRPPITSERELALQAVIEQKHTALLDLKNQVNKFCEEQGEWDFYTGDAEKALALTPDLSALKEDRARVRKEVLEEVKPEHKWCSYCRKTDHYDIECSCTRPANWVWSPDRRMAAEMRKP